MSDYINVSLDEEQLNRLINAYGEESVNRAIQITRSYTTKVQNEARNIIQEAGKVNTSRLINSIQQIISINHDKIVGEVNAATKYARFIHEGAKHDEAGDIKPFFVPFRIAPSLLSWAKRKKVIYQKTLKGKKRNGYKRGDQWYFQASSGKEYKVDIKNGGMIVEHEPLKYLEKPFNENVDSFLEEISKIQI